jgi:hypothetical protein
MRPDSPGSPLDVANNPMMPFFGQIIARAFPMMSSRDQGLRRR